MTARFANPPEPHCDSLAAILCDTWLDGYPPDAVGLAASANLSDLWNKSTFYGDSGHYNSRDVQQPIIHEHIPIPCARRVW